MVPPSRGHINKICAFNTLDWSHLKALRYAVDNNWQRDFSNFKLCPYHTALWIRFGCKLLDTFRNRYPEEVFCNFPTLLSTSCSENSLRMISLPCSAFWREDVSIDCILTMRRCLSLVSNWSAKLFIRCLVSCDEKALLARSHFLCVYIAVAWKNSIGKQWVTQ